MRAPRRPSHPEAEGENRVGWGADEKRRASPVPPVQMEITLAGEGAFQYGSLLGHREVEDYVMEGYMTHSGK